MNIKNFYQKIMVHSWVAFVAFLLMGIIVFLTISLNTKIEIIKTYHGTITEDRVVINEIVTPMESKLYIYKSKRSVVLTVNIEKCENVEGVFTVAYLTPQSNVSELEGMVNIDVVHGYTNLLKILLKIDDKYIRE